MLLIITYLNSINENRCISQFSVIFSDDVILATFHYLCILMDNTGVPNRVKNVCDRQGYSSKITTFISSTYFFGDLFWQKNLNIHMINRKYEVVIYIV